MKAYAIEVHPDIGGTAVYLMQTDKGEYTTTPQFRNATKFADYTAAKAILDQLITLPPVTMRKVVKRDAEFSSRIIFLLQLWVRLDKGIPVVYNVQAQRCYMFNKD